MKTTIKDNVLHIEIPLHAPRPSATGKTLTVASSNGNKETDIGRGAPNSSYTVQASNDLTSWQEMTTQSADASGFASHPESNLSTPRRFYRIKEAP